jgi:hypothetical protein
LRKLIGELGTAIAASGSGEGTVAPATAAASTEGASTPRAHRPGAARTKRSRAVQPGGHGRNYLRDASGRLSQPGRSARSGSRADGGAKSRLRRPRRRSNEDGALYEAGSRARRTLFRGTDAVAERLSSRQYAAWTASCARPSCSCRARRAVRLGPVRAQLLPAFERATGRLKCDGSRLRVRLPKTNTFQAELLAPTRTRRVLRDEVVAERKIVYLRNVGQGSSGLEVRRAVP